MMICYKNDIIGCRNIEMGNTACLFTKDKLLVERDWWQIYRWSYCAGRWVLYGDQRHADATRTGYIPGDRDVPLCAGAKADIETIRRARAHNRMVDARRAAKKAAEPVTGSSAAPASPGAKRGTGFQSDEEPLEYVKVPTMEELERKRAIREGWKCITQSCPLLWRAVAVDYHHVPAL